MKQLLLSVKYDTAVKHGVQNFKVQNVAKPKLVDDVHLN